MKLDMLDRKILFHLSDNSRQPDSAIAKKARASKAVVGYRIRRLVSEGAITQFMAQINISRLGYTHSKIYCRLQNATRDKEEEITRYLAGRKDSTWVARCDGRYDLAYALRIRDQLHLSEILSEIHTKFGEFLTDEVITSFLVRGAYPRKHFLPTPSDVKGSLVEDAVLKPARIDDADLALLSELAGNARASSIELAGKVGLSDDAVRARIKRLENEGVIAFYTIALDNAKLSQLHYKVLARMEGLTREKERALHSFCRLQPNIFYTVTALGPWQFEIDMEVRSPEEFRDIMRELKTEFHGIMRDYSPLIIYKIHKYKFWD